MINSKPLMFISVLSVIVLLTGCDNAMSVEDYQGHVTRTLLGAGDTELPDLAYSINITLNYMYCAEELACVIPGEMEDFREVAMAEAAYFGIYFKRICKDVNAPQLLTQDHERLCDNLNFIRTELNSLAHAAQLARDYLRSVSVDLGNPEDIAEVRKSIEGLTTQMINGKAAIQDALRDLQQIAWLDTIAQKIEQEVFSN